MFAEQCETVIEEFRQELVSRTPSLLMTILGDSVEPHGGVVWLGSLIKLVEPLGINQRLVRTSIYRLTQDNWVSADRQGRRSYYCLTDSGKRSTDQAEHRIYYSGEQNWDGEWHLILTGTVADQEKRAELRRRLVWLGFGVIAPNVYGHPVASLAPVQELLEEMEVADRVVIMRAQAADLPQEGGAMRDMVRQCCGLDDLEAGYEGFLTRYRPLVDALGDIGKASPQQCFLIRTLLIHQYRRILLRDPQLPKPLLPDNWVADQAYQVCAELYRGVFKKAEQHLLSVAESDSGAFNKVSGSYLRRFGGVKP